MSTIVYIPTSTDGYITDKENSIDDISTPRRI